jgi:negative modulator of initiation of replication
MKQIEIEDDLYKYILANIEDFGETPSQILRRLLALPAVSVQKEDDKSKKKQPEHSEVEVKPVEQQDSIVAGQKNDLSFIDSSSSLPELVAHGVAALFAEQKFQKEPIVTNKFKMMLTAMYHENRAGFIAAANTTKGRTRDYFGQRLNELLASDDKEEVEQLKASKPCNIPHTPFWVITNANTGRKRIILKKMMTAMGYPRHLIDRIKDEI